MLTRLSAIILASTPVFTALGQIPHADWAGTYLMAHGANLQGFKPEGQNLDELATAHLQPWAIEKIKWTNGVADDNGAICQLAGLFRHPSSVGGIIWIPLQDKYPHGLDDARPGRRPKGVSQSRPSKDAPSPVPG